MAKKKRMGKVSSASRGLRKSSYGCRSLTPIERLRNQQEAWLKGKRVMLVINAAGHKAEARQIWGLPPFMRKKQANADG